MTSTSTTPATEAQEPTKESGSTSSVFASQLRLLLQNLLETPKPTEKVCQNRTSEMLSIMAEDSNDHQI